MSDQEFNEYIEWANSVKAEKVALKIMQLLGFELDKGSSNPVEDVNVYLSNNYRICHWYNSAEYSITNRNNGDTSMIVDFNNVMLQYYQWETVTK